jgi:hypothetical protein
MAATKPLQEKVFSSRLEIWIKSRSPNTIDRLNKVFAEKSIGILIFVLMFTPSLPLPTGIITDVFAVITLVITFQLIIGRRTIWLPKRWSKRTIKSLNRKRAVNYLLRSLQWLERFAHPRLGGAVHNQFTLMLAGLFMFVYTLASLLAPPFSGLDTVPGMGVCLMALSLVFDDFALLVIGAIVGAIGIGITIGVGALLVSWAQQLL